MFEARALFDGEECPVHLRVAEHTGRLYLDLCDGAWRAVEIGTEGWRVVDRPPAKFRRTRGSQPLREPERGGSLDELRPFFNVDHHGWTLLCVEARDLALEASPVYAPLAELAREGFTGTVAELHSRLDSMVSDAMRRSVRWPKAPNGLGNALRRLATNLRAAGVELQFSRNDVQGRRVVSVLGTTQIRKTLSVAISSRQ